MRIGHVLRTGCPYIPVLHQIEFKKKYSTRSESTSKVSSAGSQIRRVSQEENLNLVKSNETLPPLRQTVSATLLPNSKHDFRKKKSSNDNHLVHYCPALSQYFPGKPTFVQQELFIELRKVYSIPTAQVMVVCKRTTLATETACIAAFHEQDRRTHVPTSVDYSSSVQSLHKKLFQFLRR